MRRCVLFDRNYKKLPVNWRGTQARLIAMHEIEDFENFHNAHPAFVKRDIEAFDGTEYDVSGTRSALLLVFLHYNTGTLVHTFRKLNAENKKKFAEGMWETFTFWHKEDVI